MWRVGDFERLWNRVALTLVIDETRNDTTHNYIYSHHRSSLSEPSEPSAPPSGDELTLIPSGGQLDVALLN